jgi:peptidoglycan/xylan/chitin deacetylase (PgdA/CDA1 family)
MISFCSLFLLSIPIELGLIYCFYPWLVRKFQKYGYLSHILFNVHSDQKQIALTIDDVPNHGDPQNINLIGQYLKDMKVPVNYFVIGDYLKTAMYEKKATILLPDAEILLCNHGFTNRADMWKTAKKIKQSIELTDIVIREECARGGNQQIGAPIGRFYRPASGLCGKTIIETAEQLNFKVTLGDVYPFDPHIPFARLNATKVLCDVRPGSIIILHDRSWTLSALKIIIPELLKRGYKFCTLDKLYII